jgi:hypothetical protein
MRKVGWVEEGSLYDLFQSSARSPSTSLDTRTIKLKQRQAHKGSEELPIAGYCLTKEKELTVEWVSFQLSLLNEQLQVSIPTQLAPAQSH